MTAFALVGGVPSRGVDGSTYRHWVRLYNLLDSHASDRRSREPIVSLRARRSSARRSSWRKYRTS